MSELLDQMSAPFRPGKLMSASQRRRAESILKQLYTTNEFGYTYQDPEARLDESDVRWLKKELGLETHADFGLGMKERVHRMCVNCQARHLLKYHDTRDEKNNRIEPWSIDCDYVRGDMPPNTQELADKLSTEKGLPMDEVLTYLQTTVDPVKWAEIMFGFSDASIGLGDGKERFIRNYQKEQLRCSSKRLVVREGRRSGKTFAICLKLLYLLLTHEIQEGFNPVTGEPEYRGPAIMIVTPYQMQLTNIFDELEKMIKRNQHLSRQISTGTGGGLYVRTPNYKMALKDVEIMRASGKKALKMGGQIQGFVSGVGTKSDGSGGGTMRGQSADFLYLDEMDMINDDILDKVITPIRATSPNVRILATSTPIGARSKFYDWCLERPDWKEDYYPTTVLPHWDRIRKEILAETTQEGFEAEYMAHFIEGSYGVFKPSFIEKAWADYEYAECHPQTSSKDDSVKFWMKNAGVVDPSQLRIVMGIDWNQNAGTEFVVIAYSMSEHWWWVVETHNVPQSKWTSETFKREVIRLNHKWKPDWIYADKGWGHTIIEDLHLYAMQLRTKKRLNEEEQSAVRLFDILKAFDFKANVELADPISGDNIKKEGKTFLVENAIRVMETMRLSYPFSDRNLTKQLQNYIIVKYHASTNKPVYGMAMEKVGDHRLDAFMLALGALFLEEGHFAKNNRKFVNPSLHKREDLVRREQAQNGKVDSAIEAARRAALLGDNYLSVTKVAYGETEELDALVRQIRSAEEEVHARNTAYTRPRQSRSQEFTHNTESVLDYYRAHARPDASAYSKEDWHDHLDVLKRNDAKDKQRRTRSGKMGTGKRKMF